MQKGLPRFPGGASDDAAIDEVATPGVGLICDGLCSLWRDGIRIQIQTVESEPGYRPRYLLGGDGWTDTDDAITLLAQLFHSDQVGEILRLGSLLCLHTATSACPTDVMSRRLRCSSQRDTHATRMEYPDSTHSGNQKLTFARKTFDPSSVKASLKRRRGRNCNSLSPTSSSEAERDCDQTT